MAVAPQISAPLTMKAGNASGVGRAIVCHVRRSADRAASSTGDVEDARDLGVGRLEVAAGWLRRDNRMQAEPLTGMSSGVSASEQAHAVGDERDLLVCFAQRRLLERFARFDDAARQRHLSAMPHRDRSAPSATRGRARHGEDEQQSGGVTNARRIESGGPVAPRVRRHAAPAPPHRAAGASSASSSRPRTIGEQHARRSVDRHLRRRCCGGAGYDEFVTALTTSPPSSA